MYVDDIIIIRDSDVELKKLNDQLDNNFSLKDLRILNYFLGVQVTHTPEGLFLSQSKYAKDLLCKAKMKYSRSVSTPMTTGDRLTSYGRTNGPP